MADYNQAHTDRLRYEKLYQDGAVARQLLDQAIAADVVAENSLKAAREQEALLIEGNREDELKRSAVKRSVRQQRLKILK